MLNHFAGLNVSLSALKHSSFTIAWMQKVEQCRSNCREQLNNEFFA
ncbi:hypothetical protein PCARR_a2396 [Pseudoalteromonas carrageenovora IAM 12662]|uniref:Uncharacterized protein n=1 Tax=Pseudoalteromonas carrageenovora IAM 12662 TaxID=1314868 RepID=A0ABR9EU14_PSEVC|nr:hypothetical protein [Pseudoalteromonas carrageenovora IAM 12662]